MQQRVPKQVAAGARKPQEPGSITFLVQRSYSSNIILCLETKILKIYDEIPRHYLLNTWLLPYCTRRDEALEARKLHCRSQEAKAGRTGRGIYFFV